MAAQIECVHVKVIAQGLRHPVPAARVVQAPVNQNHGGFAQRAPIPELQFQTVRVEEVRDRFQDFYASVAAPV
jgi:hypothetical protein